MYTVIFSWSVSWQKVLCLNILFMFQVWILQLKTSSMYVALVFYVWILDLSATKELNHFNCFTWISKYLLGSSRGIKYCKQSKANKFKFWWSENSLEVQGYAFRGTLKFVSSSLSNYKICWFGRLMMFVSIVTVLTCPKKWTKKNCWNLRKWCLMTNRSHWTLIQGLDCVVPNSPFFQQFWVQL